MQGFTEAGENGPLYTLLLHFWLGATQAVPLLEKLGHLAFGHNEEALVRGISALAGATAIPVMYALARRVGGVSLGVASAVLLAFNPFHIWYSQDAKMYSLLALVALLSALLYVKALESNSVRLWLGYVLAAWVAVTGLISSARDIPRQTILWVAFGIGLILTAWWTWKQAALPGRRPPATQAIVSTGAFAVWVFALGGPFQHVPGREVYGSLLLILYTLVVALIDP